MRKLAPEELARTRPKKEDIRRRQKLPIYAVVDSVRSLHNVGSIFRTADGAGVSRLFLCSITGTPPRDEIRKTSLGAEECVEWEYRKSAATTIDELKSEGVQIVVLEHTYGSVDYRKAEYRFPVCLVVGHEHHGVSEDVVARADLAVEIPMRGLKQSLNVSVAFGVAVYELVHRHENKLT